MSLSRAQLAGRLWNRLQSQFTEVGITNSDDDGPFNEAINNTLLALGVAWADLESGTVRDGNEYAALTVARYYGLSAVYDAALNRVDITIDAPNTTKRRSQFVANVKAALDAAKADALPLMTAAPSSWSYASLTLGHITTCDTEDA